MDIVKELNDITDNVKALSLRCDAANDVIINAFVIPKQLTFKDKLMYCAIRRCENESDLDSIINGECAAPTHIISFAIFRKVEMAFIVSVGPGGIGTGKILIDMSKTKKHRAVGRFIGNLLATNQLAQVNEFMESKDINTKQVIEDCLKMDDLMLTLKYK